LSPGRIVVAQVQRRTDQKPRVAAFDAYAREGGDLEALKRLRGANRLLKGPCTTLLGHGQYQLLQVEKPSVPKEEVRDAIRWRIKEMVDFPVEQASVDAIEIPAGGSGRPPQAYAVAASHGALAPLIGLFHQARVDLRVIDIPELAQRNVAALFEDENRGLALLAFDEEGGRLTFTFQGELFSTRHIDVTLQQLAQADDSLGGLFERVLLDVQRSLDNFDRNYSFISVSRLLVAPLPTAEFVDYLKANLYQQVDVMDLAQVLDLDAVPLLADPSRQSEALLAIGAALRQEAA
jgi:MSHA biogenesis protein MshI